MYCFNLVLSTYPERPKMTENPEINTETDIEDLYALSLANQEAEERAKIMASLAQKLDVLGVKSSYLEKISRDVFKAKTADIDNKKLLYLKKLLEDRLRKLIADKIKARENKKRKS
jgi:hypothetical protein